MFRSLLLVSAAGLAAVLQSLAQSTTSDNLPFYSGPLRPRVHFSPPKGWMNEPNGLFVDKNGTWHLYYQYNPTRLVAAAQHWGHATSVDLYHWTNQPIAGSGGSALGSRFSGSAVIDQNNTSGFFPDTDNGVVAIYTRDCCEQHLRLIAYSGDGGYSFTEYQHNPVLSPGAGQFRDPKVFWHETRWVMTVACRVYVIGLYTSPDLKSWTHASAFTPVDYVIGVYECPDLISWTHASNITHVGFLGWVLTISINPGSPLGGSITQYFPGEFNGTHFTPYDSAARLTNFGKDDYAGQYFFAEPYSIGWASNWQYTAQVPTGPEEGWRSAMTLPDCEWTRLTAAANGGIDCTVTPNADCRQPDCAGSGGSALGSRYFSGPLHLDQPTHRSFPSQLHLWRLLRLGRDQCEQHLRLLPRPGRRSRSDLHSQHAYPSSPGAGAILRRRIHFHALRRKPCAACRVEPVPRSKGLLAFNTTQAKRFSGVIDRSLIELYIDNGAVVGTMSFYPEEPLDKLEVSPDILY
uniref:Inulinase n=1 Tax=Papiliotrema aurea TaxID=214992 RepID=B2LYF0_9TREE|nr:inulinase [Papiliotrema aurea]